MKPKRNPQYRGRAPISEERLKKHWRGEGVDLKDKTSRIKTRIHRQKLKIKEKAIEETVDLTARAELLLTEDCGFLETDATETSLQYKQKQIANNVDITSAAKCFNLDLEFGPYSMRYTRNGRHLVLGGRKGHVAAFDWVAKKLACEINVMDSVYDVCWLHLETMFAVAQKKWVYIYDNHGTELHCLKRMNEVNRLEFLPYHFLLASAGRDGHLAWLDISIGKIISRFNSRLNRISVMAQNPVNAVLCVGDSKGVVSMWSPNSHQPLAKMLCHTQAIAACAVHPYGTYMATSCPDRSMKIWDVRQLVGPVHHAVLRFPPQHLCYSQRGLLGIAMGNVVEVYREGSDKIKPYLRHKTSFGISGMQFCPHEDILGVTTSKGFSSLLIPGSAEANFDALEINPFQSRIQRREAEVKALLDKIQPELITLDTNTIAEVDVPSLKDKVEAKKKLLHLKPKQIDFKPRRTKAKGKGGTAKILKTKKILKDLNRREHIEVLREAETELTPEISSQKIKESTPKTSYGVLDRFVAKTNRNTTKNS